MKVICFRVQELKRKKARALVVCRGVTRCCEGVLMANHRGGCLFIITDTQAELPPAKIL
jgi:hypothetical protein